MRAVNKETLIPKTVTVYVAEDGTEFKREYECREYERNIANEKVVGVRCCKELEGCPNFNGGECNENHDFYWYLPQSENDIERLNVRYRNYFDEPMLDNSYIGKWVCIEEGQDYDAWVSTLDDGIAYMMKIITALGGIEECDVLIAKKE